MENTPAFSPLEKKLLTAYIFWEICNLIAIKYTEYTCAPQIQYRVMYLAICVNTLVTAFFYWKYGKDGGKLNRVNLLAEALFMTLIADFFMTLLNLRLPGFIAFCLVELIYAAFFQFSKKNNLYRLVVFTVFLAIVFITENFSLSNIFGIINMTLLTVNVICAISFYRQNTIRWSWYLALGFALFAGCDYSILVRNLATGSLYNFAYFMTWIFYVPSQVFIVLSYVLAVKSTGRDLL